LQVIIWENVLEKYSRDLIVVANNINEAISLIISTAENRDSELVKFQGHSYNGVMPKVYNNADIRVLVNSQETKL
jgi:hypothetical protein